MASPRQFAINMQRRARNVETNSVATAKKATLAVLQTVVMATPADKGVARSNWQVSLNGPAIGVIDAYVPGKKGNTANANAVAAIVVAGPTIQSLKSGQSIHITNNLPYIDKLNQGSSQQAPAGFIEASLEMGAAQVRGVKLLGN